MFLLLLILDAFHSMFRVSFVLLILRYQGCTVCFEGKPWSAKNDRVYAIELKFSFTAAKLGESVC